MMTTPGVTVDEDGRKTFIPLENNPDVFTHLVHKLGISSKIRFHDVYSTDDPDLLAFIPRPAHSLIFIAPAPVYNNVRAQDPPHVSMKELTYEGTPRLEPVMWFKQTIGNACGLYALLHCIGNGPARDFIVPGSDFAKFMEKAAPLKPLQLADMVYNWKELEEAHMDAAIRGDTAAPPSDDPIGYHFIAFVKGKDGHLWEMEGDANGPIDRGELGAEDDMLSEKALDLGVRRYMRLADGNLEFSIVVLGIDPEAEGSN